MDVWQLSAENGQEKEFLLDLTVVSTKNHFLLIVIGNKHCLLETDIRNYRRINRRFKNSRIFGEAGFNFSWLASHGPSVVPFLFPQFGKQDSHANNKTLTKNDPDSLSFLFPKVILRAKLINFSSLSWKAKNHLFDHVARWKSRISRQMKDLFSLAPCWDDRGVWPHPSNLPPLPLIGVFQDILEVSFGGFVVVFFWVWEF